MLNAAAIGRIAVTHVLAWVIPVILIGTPLRTVPADNRPLDCGAGHHDLILDSPRGAISIVAEHKVSSPSESIQLLACSVTGVTEHPAGPAFRRDLLRTERSGTRPIALILVGTLNTSSSL